MQENEKSTIYVEQFMTLLQGKLLEINNKEDNIITNELINGIEIKTIYNSLTEDNQVFFWKHIQALYVIGFQYLRTDGNVDFKELWNNFKLQKESNEYKQLKELIGSLEKPKNLNKLESMMNSSMLTGTLGKLAQEVINDIDIESLNIDTDNPMEMLTSMLNGNLGDNNGLMNMVQNVATTLHNKVESGEVDPTQLLSEAQSFMTNFKDFIPKDLQRNINLAQNNTRGVDIRGMKRREQLRKKLERRRKELEDKKNEFEQSKC